jgi:hypothetical protein
VAQENAPNKPVHLIYLCGAVLLFYLLQWSIDWVWGYFGTSPSEFKMSLVAAIASAQGAIKDAYLSYVAVVRGSLTKPEIAVVDYKAITHGQSPDVLLEPGDIVYVPYVPYRTLERYANLILNTFVSTVAINEGARAVTRNVVPVGVSIGGGAAH